MYKLKEIVAYFYQHKLIRYLFVGGTTFFIDFGMLVILHGHFDVNLQLATSIAYWTSVSYNFTLNRNWTFSATENNKLHKHMLFYGVLLAFNYAFTLIFVSIGSHFMSYAIAKTLAVIVQTTWTYRLYKHVIFKDKPLISV